MNTRIKLLNSLLEFDKPLAEILPALNSLGWDSEQSLVILQRQHITNILQRYLDDKLSASDVENWANAIEGREDIEYESDFAELLAEAIYEIANPLLTHPLSKLFAQQWLAKFADSTISVYQ